MSEATSTSKPPATAAATGAADDEAKRTTAVAAAADGSTATAAATASVRVRTSEDKNNTSRSRSGSRSSGGSSSSGHHAPSSCRHAAARDEAARSTVPPALLQSARDIVTRTFDTYALQAIGVAFNGGKDCVVMTELIRATVGVERLRQCCVFVLEEADEFGELARFREHYVATRLPGATLHHIDAKGDLCRGLWMVKERFAIDAVFIGTRKSDPDGKYQKSPCEPTTAGWPPMMRVCPLLDWDYRDVWSYILTHKVPYCELYGHGYTSLGNRDCTARHTNLRNDDGSYCPAWHLESSARERDGRA